jgi:hypothetical protein
MNRREALRLLGASTIAPRFLHWEPDALVDGINGMRKQMAHARRPHPARPSGAYRFQALDAHQQATVAELSEMIIPATDTPGAKAGKVDEFIDIILAEWSTDAERAAFLNGLADLDAAVMVQYKCLFVDAAADQRATILRTFDDQLTAARAARKAWKPGEYPEPPDHRQLFWHQMRSLTVSGYYSSEVGYKLERKNVLVPGIYRACLSVEAP